MNQREAESELDGKDLLPVVEGALPSIKDLLQQCLEADVPATIGRPPGKGKS